VLAGLGCTFAGLCYAEFAAMIPVAGSAYTYAYATMGEFLAWIIGWDLILEYLFSASTVASGWSGYFTRFLSEDLGVHLPAVLCKAPFHENVDGMLVASGAWIDLPAVLLVGVLTFLLVIGIRQSANVNNLIVFLKVAIVVMVIVFGFQYVNTDNWKPFVPDNNGTFGEFGWSGILSGAGLVFFAYIGFDAVSTAAQEAKNPQKDMKFGILGSLVVCTVLYILMAAVMTGLAHYSTLNVEAPVSVAIANAGKDLRWLELFATIGALAGLASVVLVTLLGQARIFYSMARDGLLPGVFSRVHPRFQTPVFSSIVIGVVAAAVAGLLPLSILGDLVAIGTLLAFVIVCIGIMVLRKTRPDLPRPFRTPFVPVVPLLGVGVCGALMFGLSRETWLRLGIWLFIGLVIYGFYGRHRSKLAKPAA
jgi:APA family basic amino acid/polyamine antiporter